MELRREIEFYLSFTDEEVLEEWTSLKKKKAVPWFLPLPTSLLSPIFLAPLKSLRFSQYPSQCQRRKLQCMPGGKKRITPIPASISHWGDSRTSHNTKVQGKNQTAHSNNPYNPATLLIKGPIAASISPTSKSLGIEVASHSTLRLCWSNSPSKNTRSHGGRLGDARGLHVHRAGIDPWHFKCEFEPCGQR